jgi:hypothetical protein
MGRRRSSFCLKDLGVVAVEPPEQGSPLGVAPRIFAWGVESDLCNPSVGTHYFNSCYLKKDTNTNTATLLICRSAHKKFKVNANIALLSIIFKFSNLTAVVGLKLSCCLHLEFCPDFRGSVCSTSTGRVRFTQEHSPRCQTLLFGRKESLIYQIQSLFSCYHATLRANLSTNQS